MTALVEQVLDYLVRWSAWLGVVVAGSAVLAGAVWAAVRMVAAAPDLRRTILWSTGGAIVLASLAHRLGVAGPEVGVWRHELPWAWAAAGAVLGATAVAAVSLSRRAPDGGRR